jgi:hypothetical protein
MKIILSRKGFDSSTGGVPSPIFRKADDTLGLYPLPIPHQASTCDYADLYWRGGALQPLITSVRKGCRTRLPHPPHLDPDLVRGARRDRHPDWRPIFGQAGSAEGHLRKQGVGVLPRGEDFLHNGGSGPLFLFFGLYGMTADVAREFEFVGPAKNSRCTPCSGGCSRRER